MKSTVTSPSEFLARLNLQLAESGRKASCVLATPGDSLNFSRLTAPPEVLEYSYSKVMQELGATGGIAIPRAYKVRDGHIHYALGPGFGSGSTNPNRSGMGLVMHRSVFDDGLALGVTFADAPGAVVVHVPSGITAAVSGIWTELGQGTVDKTIALMRDEATAMGYLFDQDDLWVILSPGARRGFLIDERGRQKLLVEGSASAQYAATYVTPVTDQDRPYELDLAGLFHELWRSADVPVDQVFFDPRDTLNEVDAEGNHVLPSKRTADKLGKPEYSSGILALLVR